MNPWYTVSRGNVGQTEAIGDAGLDLGITICRLVSPSLSRLGPGFPIHSNMSQTVLIDVSKMFYGLAVTGWGVGEVGAVGPDSPSLSRFTPVDSN